MGLGSGYSDFRIGCLLCDVLCMNVCLGLLCMLDLHYELRSSGSGKALLSSIVLKVLLLLKLQFSEVDWSKLNRTYFSILSREREGMRRVHACTATTTVCIAELAQSHNNDEWLSWMRNIARHSDALYSLLLFVIATATHHYQHIIRLYKLRCTLPADRILPRTCTSWTYYNSDRSDWNGTKRKWNLCEHQNDF